MDRTAGRMKKYRAALAIALLGAAFRPAPAQPPAPAEPMDNGPSVVELKPEEVRLQDHKVAPDAAVHLTAAEYREAMKTPLFVTQSYVDFEIVVSQNGRVDSARAVGGTKLHLDEAEQIEMARVFKPWSRDGVIVRARLHDFVVLLPPEQWADVHVPFPESWDAKTASVGLKRTVCYGACPDYAVTVSGDGTVHYRGGTSVAIVGDHVAHISPEAARELVLAFKSADFLSAKDEYRGNWTDNPTQTLTLALNGHTKTVVDYVGTDAGLPLAVRNLEDQIDKVAGTARWVKGNEQTLASLDEEKWPFTAATKQNIVLYDRALSTGNQPLVERYLAAHGPIVSPDIEVASPVCLASGFGNLELVDRMREPVAALKGAALKKIAVPTAVAQQCLWSAASSGSVPMLQYWLDLGADPTAQPAKEGEDYWSQNDILVNGIMSRRPEMVRKLLEYKVDVNAQVQDQPLLSFALRRGALTEVVELLVKAGADVKARGSEDEPVIFSAEYTPESIKPLLAAGADVDARDGNGNTALIRYAFMEGMVRELLADGADPTAVAKNGDTALIVTKKYPGCPACVTMIEEALKQRAANSSVAPDAPQEGR